MPISLWRGGELSIKCRLVDLGRVQLAGD